MSKNSFNPNNINTALSVLYGGCIVVVHGVFEWLLMGVFVVVKCCLDGCLRGFLLLTEAIWMAVVRGCVVADMVCLDGCSKGGYLLL